MLMPKKYLNQAGVIHILAILTFLILAAGLVAGLYLVQKTQIFKPKAAEIKTSITESKPDPAIKSLTDELLGLDRQYDQSQAAPYLKEDQASIQAKLDKMVEIAKKRKGLLLQKLKDEKPQDFLVNANLADERDAFPEAIKPYIEKKVQDKGELTVIHGDDFKNKKSTYNYFLGEKTDKNKPTPIYRYRLHFKNIPELISGSQIQVEAITIDRDAAVTDTQILSASQVSAITPVTGDQKTLVMMIRLSNDTSPPSSTFTKDYINNFMFGTSPDFNSVTVNSYYKDNSFNKISFSGDVVGEYVIDDSPSCEEVVWAHYADIAAVNNGINLGNYQRRIYVFKNWPSSCVRIGIGGLGTIGVNPSQSWIYYNNWYVYLHELGHNLGNAHANFLKCGQNAIDTPTKCQNIGYGDSTDMMGDAGSKFIKAQFNAPHKVAMGWITNVQTVNSSGTYTVAPLESTTTQPQILRISKPDTSEYYYISYRQKTGYDSDFYGSWVNGANIHVWNESSFIQTKLLDAYPSSVQNGQETLSDGITFFDQINNISVKQISHILSTDATMGSVTLQVKLPESDSARRVFVTSTTYNGNLKLAGSSVGLGAATSGLNGADKICQSRANIANRGGIWKAWISDDQTSATSRLDHSTVPYKRIDNVFIAGNWLGLTSGNLLIDSISVNEYGNSVATPTSSHVAVWTATNTTGNRITFANCSNWTSTSSNSTASIGYADLRGPEWTFVATASCDNNLQRLYCFEEPVPFQLLSFNPGWNLISLNVEPITPSLTQLLKPLEGRYERVLGENGVFSTSIPDAFNTLRDMHIGQAYYVRLSGTTTADLQVNGLRDSPSKPLNLHQGWNWIGYLPISAMKVTDALKSIEGKYQRILSLDKIYMATLPNFSTLQEMVPSQGYLIYMTEAARLTYPEVLPAQPLQTGHVKGINSSCQTVVRTPSFTLVYGQVMINGVPAPVDTRVEAVTTKDIAAGCFLVERPGDFGLVFVYGEDTSGIPIPGFKSKEDIIWYVNGQIAIPDKPLIWQNDQTPHTISLNLKTSAFPSPTPCETYGDLGFDGVLTSGKTFNRCDNIKTSPSPVSSPQVGVYTTHYRMSDDLNVLNTLPWKEYTKDSMVVDYEFVDKTPGTKFIWVEFKDSTGKIERKNIQINLESSTSVSSPSPQSSAFPTPSSVTAPTTTTGTITSTPNTAGTYTVSYRIASDPNALSSAPKIPYTYPLILDYEFPDKTPGTKFIWVEFEDNTGKTERRNIQVELIAPPSQIIPETQYQYQDTQENAGADAF